MYNNFLQNLNNDTYNELLDNVPNQQKITEKRNYYHKCKNDIGLYCDVTSRFADERLAHLIKSVLRTREWLEQNDPNFPK